MCINSTAALWDALQLNVHSSIKGGAVHQQLLLENNSQTVSHLLYMYMYTYMYVYGYTTTSLNNSVTKKSSVSKRQMHV